MNSGSSQDFWLLRFQFQFFLMYCIGLDIIVEICIIYVLVFIKNTKDIKSETVERNQNVKSILIPFLIKKTWTFLFKKKTL